MGMRSSLLLAFRGEADRARERIDTVISQRALVAFLEAIGIVESVC